VRVVVGDNLRVATNEASVEAFRCLAESYCALVEQIEQLEPSEVLRRLSVLLPALIAKATELPDLEPTEGYDAPEISHGVWSERFAAIDSTLGHLGGYWTTMEVRSAAEPGVVPLPVADDLVDIWRDLRGGLDALTDNGTVADAVWEWRFNFGIHWGAHAIEALRAVHAALHD
jgi:hypothetical protein